MPVAHPCRARALLNRMLLALLLLGSCGSAWAMEIFIDTADSGIITLEVYSSDSIQQIKHMIESETGVPVEQQRLFFGSQELDDGRTLSDCNIQPGATLTLLLKPLAGPATAVPGLGLPGLTLLILLLAFTTATRLGRQMRT